MEMGRKIDGGTDKWSSTCTAFSGFYCKISKFFFKLQILVIQT